MIIILVLVLLQQGQKDWIFHLRCQYPMRRLWFANLKKINNNENLRTFLDGSMRSVIILESIAIGRGEYLPGWRWSLHASPQTGKSSEAHIGCVLSGKMAVRTASGKEIVIGPGEVFEVQPGHDAWVVGDKPCIALDFECIKKGTNIV